MLSVVSLTMDGGRITAIDIIRDPNKLGAVPDPETAPEPRLVHDPPAGRQETADGSQQPMLNVFHRDGQTIRYFWGSELFYAPANPRQEPRHVGTIEPLWNLFDLAREGRPANWHEQFSF